jgi:predicted lysophospholipase L1 biosynthesis ABC-type transport system permease subunit
MGLTLPGLAVLDLSRKRSMAGVQIAGLATAVALAVALPLMQSVAAEQGLHSALSSLGAGANLQIGLDQVGELKAFDTFQSDASRRVKSEMGGIMIPAARFARSNQLQPVSLNGQQLVHEPGDPFAVATYFEKLDQHVVVTSGSWPADGKSGDAWWATLSDAAAQLLGLKVGDLYCLGPTGGVQGRRGPGPWCAQIAATWKARNPAEPYWARQTLGTDLTVGRSSLFDIAAATGYTTVHAGQLYVTDLSRVHATDADSIRDHLRHLHGVYGVTSDATFITGLDTAIETFLTRLRAEQVLAVGVEVALIALAIYAIALAAIHFMDGQKRVLGLWRARGGSRRSAWLLLMVQFGVLSLVALPVGALIGIAAVIFISGKLFNGGAGIDGGILASAAPTLLAALAGIVVVLGLLAAGATIRTVADVRRGESRPEVSAWWRWRNLDLGLAIAGVLLIAEARLQAGQSSLGAGQDPIGLILPGVALALLAVAALRLLPLIAQQVARAPGLGMRLAGWRLQREPLQHARVALLLSLALALSLFTSAYLATDQRNAVDRARYATGGYVRAWFGFGTGPSVVDGAVSAAPGLQASSLLYRDDGRPGRSDVSTTVLGVDPYTLASVAWWRSDLARQPLDQLMSTLVRSDPDGAAIPGRPQTLSMWVYSSGLDASLEADLRGATGRPIHASFGSLSSSGWNQMQASLGGLAAQDFPLRLRTLSMTATGPRTTGEIDLSELRAGPSASLIEAFSAADGWWQEMFGQFGGVSALQVGPRLHDGEASTGMTVDVTGGATLALHPAASPAALPGIIASQTAAKLGVNVGQSLPLHIETNDVTVRLVGTVDYFPTVYPGQDDFLLIPSESLVERLRRMDTYAYPNEAWIHVSGSPAAADRAIQNALHGRGHVEDRESLETAALNSPLRLSLEAALVIGLVAALTMVVIGFGLHFLAVARSRVSESAIMQANGLPWRVVDQALLTEQVVVLGHGVVVGTTLGALMAWTILPVLQTSDLPTDLVPPTVVALNGATLIAAALAVLLAAGVVGQLAMRSASRFRLNDELRALA